MSNLSSKMKIYNVKYVEGIEIILDEKQTKEITKEFLMKRFDIPENAFIRGTKLFYKYNDGIGQHKFWREELHRDVKKGDKEILKILKDIELF